MTTAWQLGDQLESDERVVRVDLRVVWDAGAPCPQLIRSEDRTFLAFFCPNDTFGPGRGLRIVEPHDEPSGRVAIIEWQQCIASLAGWPNDEVLNGHRLWPKGLAEIGVHTPVEVMGSQWIAELEMRNRIHPRHTSSLFEGMRHFVLPFKDSTFECVARSFLPFRSSESLAAVVGTLARCALSDEPLPFESVSETAPGRG